MAVNKTLSKPAAEDTLTEDMGVSETSRPIHWRFDLSSIHRTFAAAAIVVLPVAFAADRVEAATGSFLLDLQNVGVIAAYEDPGGPWAGVVTGDFMVQSTLAPDAVFGLVTPYPDWTLTGNFSGEFADDAGVTPVSFNGTETFSAQPGVSVPASAFQVVGQTLPFSSSMLFTLFAHAADIAANAVDAAPGTVSGGHTFDGTEGFFPAGDTIGYSAQVTSFGPNSFGGNFSLELGGDDFSASMAAFDLPLFTTGSFDLSMELEPFSATAPIPVPAALPLLAGGLGVLGVMGWRRRRQAAD